MTSNAGIGSVTTEGFDASNTQTSKTVTQSMDNSVSGGIVLGETAAGAITIKANGGHISLGDNTVLNGTTVQADSADLTKPFTTIRTALGYRRRHSRSAGYHRRQHCPRPEYHG
ncbi:MAG: hypothetical protein ACLSUW_06060 [Akkermansia sp.]